MALFHSLEMRKNQFLVLLYYYLIFSLVALASCNDFSVSNLKFCRLAVTNVLQDPTKLATSLSRLGVLHPLLRFVALSALLELKDTLEYNEILFNHKDNISDLLGNKMINGKQLERFFL